MPNHTDTDGEMERLASEIERLSEAATPLPWHKAPQQYPGVVAQRRGRNETAPIFKEEAYHPGERTANILLTTTLRNSVPKILAALRLSADNERLKEENDVLKEQLRGERVRALDEAAKVAITVAARYGEKHLIGREVMKAIYALFKPEAINRALPSTALSNPGRKETT